MHPLRLLCWLLPLLGAGCTAPDIPSRNRSAGDVSGIDSVFQTHEAYSTLRLERSEVQAFLSGGCACKGDSAAIARFYARRNYQYAWIVNDSLSQAALAFLDLSRGADTLFPSLRELREEAGTLLGKRYGSDADTPPCDSCLSAIELGLTALFFRLADQRYSGIVGRDPRELAWFIPRRKKDPSRLIDSIAAGHMDLSAWEPIHPQYGKLKDRLRDHHRLNSMNDWPILDLGETRKIEPGGSHALVSDLRHRLILLGDLSTTEDTAGISGDTYDSTMVMAVRRFQERHGLTADGIVGRSVLAALNVTPQERLRTILVNMERLRWMPEMIPPDLILVNIPEYRMHVYEGGEEVLSMDVVVGTAATRTVIFNDSLSHIVFSPTWSIPQSIVRNEILPALARDPGYLKRKGMERIGGSDANPVIRQRPGAGNALGRVKFIFPNSYNIYLHDTPGKGVFAREKRAFSHGCIRLDKPTELAEHLLRNDSTWTPAAINAAMFSEREQYVRLKRKRPVTIAYFTSWVDANGLLHFRDDVYGHDARLALELFGTLLSQ
jgi:murein L,D-transpeptidase YcbB/YkuD